MPISLFNNLFKGNGGSSNQSDAFGIDKFAAEIGKNGFAKGQYFSVMLSCNHRFSGTTRAFPLRIESVNMPGRNLFTMDQNYYGPMRMIPYRASYQPVTLTVIMSEDMYERNFFLNWQDQIIGGRRNDVVTRRDDGKHDPYFYDEYVGSMDINFYAESPHLQKRGGGNSLLQNIKEVANIAGIDPSKFTSPFGFNIPFLQNRSNNVREVYKVTLNEVYPISVQDVPLSWGDDTYTKLQIEMRYYDYTETYTAPQAPIGRGILSSIRSSTQAFQRFAPVFSAVKNVGFKGTVRGAFSSVGRSIQTQGRSARAILPF